MFRLLVCAAGFRPHEGLYQPTFNEGELILFMNDFFIRDFGAELRYFWCQKHLSLSGKDWIPVLSKGLEQVNVLQEYLILD